MKSRIDIIVDYRFEPECGFWNDADDDECPIAPIRLSFDDTLMIRVDQANVLLGFEPVA